MENSIIINVNLPGAIGGSRKAEHKIKNTILLTNPKTKETYPSTRKIKHSNRDIRDCRRTTTIPGSIVTSWIQGDCPSWERFDRWKKMSKRQKLKSYVDSFDEGFGVSYEIIDDGET